MRNQPAHPDAVLLDMHSIDILNLYRNKGLVSLGFYGTDRLTPPVEGPIIIEEGKVCCIACRSNHKDVHCLRMHMARSH